MKKHCFIFAILYSFLVASCAVQTPMVTDASYETYREVNCKSDYEEIYVFYENPNFRYSEIGQLTITSSSVDTDYLAENHKQESMLNMAKYVAWMNCADGVTGIKQYKDSLTAKAIYFEITPELENQYASNLETGFIEYINKEMATNEALQYEEKQWNPEFTNMLIDASFLILMLLVAQ